MYMKRIVIVLALIATVTGCATDKKTLAFSNAAAVHSGMTRQEVVKAMGAEPDRIFDEGTRYVYADHPDAPQTGRSVSIQFSSEGKTVGAPVLGSAPN
jgi:hypothetical protein